MIENGQPGGGYLLIHDNLKIPFQVKYGERKNLTIHVHPDLRLEVLAPSGRSLHRVLKRVDARSNWVAKQWRFFQQYQPEWPERKYISGETHLYLGRQYRLKITKSDVSAVKLKGRFLHVFHNNKDDQVEIKELVSRWYKEHAIHLFNRRLQFCLENCKSLRISKPPQVHVRKMTRRWGSCTKIGNISLNLDLVKTPVHCVDYVIVHELCHIKIHNHSPDFYRLLSQCMPDWERRKHRLDLFRLE